MFEVKSEAEEGFKIVAKVGVLLFDLFVRKPVIKGSPNVVLSHAKHVLRVTSASLLQAPGR
jgi:hypothetical protein